MDVVHSKMKSNWRFYLKTGKSVKLAAEIPMELRLYSPHELMRLWEEAGWKVSAIYDSLTYRRPFSPNVNGLTAIAEAV